MPASYSLSDSVLEITLEGSYTSAEALVAFEQGIASVPPDTRPGVLIDVTKSEELRSYETMQRIADRFGAHSASLSGRIAVVVSTQARFGKARQFGALVEGHGLDARPFHDRPTAISWLQGGGLVDRDGQSWVLDSSDVRRGETSLRRLLASVPFERYAWLMPEGRAL